MRVWRIWRMERHRRERGRGRLWEGLDHHHCSARQLPCRQCSSCGRVGVVRRHPGTIYRIGVLRAPDREGFLEVRLEALEVEDHRLRLLPTCLWRKGFHQSKTTKGEVRHRRLYLASNQRKGLPTILPLLPFLSDRPLHLNLRVPVRLDQHWVSRV